MATRTREGVPGKEKRGTSPSAAPTLAAAQRRRSPKPSKATSPVRSPDSAEAEKHVPNYLKPTVCSGLDASSKQQGKKPVFSPDKPALGRRRSFDKPPSASAATRISPNPVRTSSFSGKGISDKNPRVSKDSAGKQHNGLYARPVTAAVKKSTGAGAANVKKKETGSGSSKTTTTNTTTEQVSSPTEKMDVSSVTDVSETETLSENQESPVAAECEKQQGIVQIGECDEEVEDQESGAMDSVMEDENGVKDLKASNIIEEESIKFEQAEEEDNTDDTNKMVTTETCLEIHEAKIVSIDTCSTAEDHQETDEQEDHNSHVEDPKEPTSDEANKSDTEDNNPSIQHEEIEEKQGEEEVTVTDINETEESKEMEVEKEVVEENPTPEAADPGASRAQVVQGKKESAVVSNDVIEETAKQLREQRKNKVKALAGAFETVISLQEHK